MARALILAALAIVLSYPVHRSANAQPRTAEDQRKAAEQPPPTTTEAIENHLASIASAIKAPQTGREAEAAEKRAQDDLNAQQDMARYALWMFLATAVTALLTAAGVLLIWRTLIHTRRASKYAGVGARQARRAAIASDRMAEEAAKATLAAVDASKAGQEANRLAREAQREARSIARQEARKSQRREAEADERAEAAYAIAERNAKAMADQVELARDTASKELRAYIGVLWAKAYYVGAPLSRVVILIKNFGKTPAFEVVAQTGLYIDTHQTGFPGKGENGSMPIIAREFGIVEPGQERVIWIDLPDDWIRENLEDLRNGTARLFSQTKINYSDVGGVDRHRGFCCYLPDLRNSKNREDPGAIPMTITASGNVDSWVGQWAKVTHLPPSKEGG